MTADLANLSPKRQVHKVQAPPQEPSVFPPGANSQQAGRPLGVRRVEGEHANCYSTGSFACKQFLRPHNGSLK